MYRVPALEVEEVARVEEAHPEAAVDPEEGAIPAAVADPEGEAIPAAAVEEVRQEILAGH